MSTPSKTTNQDQRLATTIQEEVLRTCPEEALKKSMQYIFMVVGIKGQNIPVSPEKEFLHQYIRTHYGNHTPGELCLAFDMAIQGRLRIPMSEVKCYENFSVQYFAAIMSAYQEWAHDARRQLPAPIVPHTPSPEPKVNWRPMIEDAYQHFLSFGPERVHLLPVGFYDQLVEDQAFRPDLYRIFMKEMRKRMIAEQVRERTIALNNIQAIRGQIDNKRIKGKDLPTAENNLAKMKSAIKITELKEEKIEKGERDGEIVVMAKQHLVMEYFKELKEKGLTSVYTTKDPQEEAKP